MKRFNILKLTVIVTLTMMLGALVCAQDDQPQVGSGAVKGGLITIEVGSSHVLKNVASYEIANASVVTAQPADNGDLILKGTSPGQTTILVRKTGLMGLVQYDVRVEGTNVEETLRTVRGALGGILGLVIRQEGNVIVLEGEITNRADAMRVDRQLSFFGNKIIDLTERQEVPQIEVDVEIYTVDMSKAKDIGDNSLLAQITTVKSSGWEFQGGQGSLSTSAYPTISVGEFQTKLNALLTDGSSTNVSKQHASVRAGETAVIRNTRTEYVPVAGVNTGSLEEIETGQILEIKPNFSNNGRFETKVNIELSELGAGGANISANRRTVSSTYISSQNETVVLGGTTKESTVMTEEGTPFLRHIPIIGKLFFRKKASGKSEVVQIFFMTLRAPNTFEAQDERQSNSAKDVIKRTKDQAEEDNNYTEPKKGLGKWQ